MNTNHEKPSERSTTQDNPAETTVNNPSKREGSPTVHQSKYQPTGEAKYYNSNKVTTCLLEKDQLYSINFSSFKKLKAILPHHVYFLLSPQGNNGTSDSNAFSSMLYALASSAFVYKITLVLTDEPYHLCNDIVSRKLPTLETSNPISFSRQLAELEDGVIRRAKIISRQLKRQSSDRSSESSANEQARRANLTIDTIKTSDLFALQPENIQNAVNHYQQLFFNIFNNVFTWKSGQSTQLSDIQHQLCRYLTASKKNSYDDAARSNLVSLLLEACEANMGKELRQLADELAKLNPNTNGETVLWYLFNALLLSAKPWVRSRFTEYVGDHDNKINLSTVRQQLKLSSSTSQDMLAIKEKILALLHGSCSYEINEYLNISLCLVQTPEEFQRAIFYAGNPRHIFGPLVEFLAKPILEQLKSALQPPQWIKAKISKADDTMRNEIRAITGINSDGDLSPATSDDESSTSQEDKSARLCALFSETKKDTATMEKFGDRMLEHNTSKLPLDQKINLAFGVLITAALEAEILGSGSSSLSASPPSVTTTPNVSPTVSRPTKTTPGRSRNAMFANRSDNNGYLSASSEADVSMRRSSSNMQIPSRDTPKTPKNNGF